MKTKNIKYWGQNFLEGMGISILCAVVFSFFQICRGDYSQGMSVLMIEVLSLFPYYLFFSTAFVILMLVIGYFQVYFSVLVSVNALRKNVARGIGGSIGLTAATTILAAGVIWKLVPGDIAEAGIKILPLLSGILFLASGIFLIFGGAAAKWGKVGKIIVTILCMGMGAAAGITLAMDSDVIPLIMKLAEGHFMPVCMIGVVLYLISCVLVEWMTRKFEVHV